MKEFAYLEKHHSKYQLYLFNDEKEDLLPTAADGEEMFASGELAAVEACLLSRRDFEVKALELPPLKEKDITGFIKFKLRSLYPGNPDETSFDYRLLTVKNKTLALLFITQTHTLEEYKKLAREKPLLLPFNLIQSAANKYLKGKAACFFWHREWIEIITYNDSEINTSPVSSYVLKRTTTISQDIKHICQHFPADFRPDSCVFFCFNGEKESLTRWIKDERLNQEPWAECELVFLSIQDALNKLKGSSHYLFSLEKQKLSIPLHVRIQALVFIILVLACLLYKKGIDQDKAYYSELSKHLRNLQNQNIMLITAKTKAEQMKIQFDKLQKSKPVDLYYTLSELESVMGDGIVIESFNFENNKFTIEALGGKGSLKLMESFKAKEQIFKDVKLNQSTIDKTTGKERFRITGNINGK